MATTVHTQTAIAPRHAHPHSPVVDLLYLLRDIDYTGRRVFAGKHVEVYASDWDRHMAEEAAWVIRCVHAGDRQPRGAHVAAGVSR